jgi:glycosyltransferase involved in cell wall biosynthesis
LRYEQVVILNIVHFIASLEVGGLERMVLGLAGLQKRRGHSVTIGCLLGEGRLAVQARAAGIQVFHCDKRAGPELRSIMIIRQALRAARAEVLHTHNAVPHYYASAAALGLGLRRIISTRHNMGVQPYSARREALYKFAMRWTDSGVSVCQAAHKNFVAHRVISVEKAQTIVNGIDLDQFTPREPAARTRINHALGLPVSAVVVASVGRLSEVKNPAMMLQAIKSVRARGVEVALLMIGDGPLRGALESLSAELGISDAVHFLGIRDDVADLLKGSDVYLQSSLTEGYSMALVEASSAQLPILATDVGGNAEIVQNGQTGCLVASGDVAAMADALEKLALDSSARLRMGAAARVWAVRAGSLDTMYSAYLRLYGETRS